MSGGQLRSASIQKSGGQLISRTNLIACNAKLTANIFAAGLYPSTTYVVNYEVVTGSTVNKGPTPVNFTTGPLPSTITFPKSTVITPRDRRTINRTILCCTRIRRTLWLPPIGSGIFFGITPRPGRTRPQLLHGR